MPNQTTVAMTDKELLQIVEETLASAHGVVEQVAALMECYHHTEDDLINNRAYGLVCRTLGILEEQITTTENQIKAQSL